MDYGREYWNLMELNQMTSASVKADVRARTNSQV